MCARLCSHILTPSILHAPLKQSALSGEQWSIKKPLIMALYSLLLMLILIYSHLLSSPSAEWLALLLKARTMRRGGESHPSMDRGCGGSLGRSHSSGPPFLCVYIGNCIVQMEELSNSAGGENDISQLLLKKIKIRKEGRGKLLINHVWSTG